MLSIHAELVASIVVKIGKRKEIVRLRCKCTFLINEVISQYACIDIEKLFRSKWK